MPNRTLIRVVPVLVLLVGPAAAYGQAPAPMDRSFSPQLFHPSVGPDHFLSIQPARPLEHLNFALGLWLNYARGSFSLLQVGVPDPGGKRPVGQTLSMLQKDAFAADLTFAIGLFDRWQIGIGVPMTLAQAGDAEIVFPSGSAYAVTPPSGYAMGDPTIEAKVRVWGGDKGGPQLALAGAVGLPLSVLTPDNFGGQAGTITDRKTGEAHPNTVGVGLALRVLAGWEGARWRAGLMYGFQYRQNESLYLSTVIGSNMVYGGAFAYDVIKDRKLSVLGEIYGRTDVAGTRISNVDATAVEFDIGIKLRFARSFYGTIAAGTGVFRGVGAPQVRVLGGLSWAPDRRDRDKDGVPDQLDKCPDQAEDRDGWKDDDGCPEPDNDGDAIPDVRDKCPGDPEDFDTFEDDDGCPELDNDKDGMPDILDHCPVDKEDGKPPKPKDGCPADKMDSDEDGIPDARDKCPLDLEDKDNFEDADGCPDIDNDNDGIPDQFDKCPNEAEDNDGFADDDGCPEPDNDHDGLLDAHDRCPMEPETINGVADDDGCPDRGPQLKVQVVGDELVILEKIYFKNASAIIEARSHNLLDQVASVMKFRHDLTLVLIEGHTDTRGNPAKNQKLSQDRADGVKHYLVHHGVHGDRLTARGFGGTHPVADNKSERGREANRRVQFRILEQKRVGAPPEGAPR